MDNSQIITTAKMNAETAFESLKCLEGVPVTPGNVSILNGVYELLRVIYNDLGGIENVGSDTKDRTAADPG